MQNRPNTDRARKTHSANMQALRDELHKYSIKELSLYSGLSTNALYNIRGGRTNWPRRDTWDQLLSVLGMDLVLTKL